jgi:hypothetical protein
MSGDGPPAPGVRGLAWLAAAGVALRLALVWSGGCDNRVIADDAFYYFTIARNLAAGHGATFDGLAPTNGFHPLWLLLLTPLYALAGALRAGSWTAVHMALSLCAALDLATGLLLWRLLRRLGCPRGAHAAAAVWFLAPLTVLLSLRGLESALNVTLFAAWLAAVARTLGGGVSGGAGTAVRRGAVVGVVSGLAFLARTDNGPLLGLALAAVTLVEAVRTRELRRPLTFLVAAGAVAALIALPWLLWNLATFGTPWQVSGAAKLANPLIFGRVPRDPGNTLRYLAAFVWVPAFFVAGESMKHRAAFLAVAAVEWTLLALLAPFLAGALARPRAAAQRPVVVALLVYLVAHAAVYVLALRAYVVWYATVPVFALVVLFAGLAAERLLGRLPAAARVTLALVALLAAGAGFTQYFRATHLTPRGEELVVRPILTRIAREAPGTRSVGVYNAGAAGYFAPEIGPFTVVNLDGLVNNRAVEAWRDGRYFEYLDHNVDVIIDDADATLTFMLGRGNRARFDARYPQWSSGSLVHGPRLQARAPERGAGARNVGEGGGAVSGLSGDA